VPPELAAVLAGDETGRGVYDGLSLTHRDEDARWIAGAKRQETRERRVREAIEMLSEGIKHP
jgi:uncharacterized protein YdeI (YjbR/CyaY-like superfamily)